MDNLKLNHMLKPSKGNLGKTFFIIFLFVFVVFPFLKHPDRFYDVEVLVEAEGELHTINATLKCEYKRAGLIRFFPLADGAAKLSGYGMDIASVGYRLPSGAGLVIHPGKYCAANAPRAWSLDGEANDFDEIPTVYWLDNADKPDVIEAYVSEVYYQHPEARIKLLSLQMTSASWWLSWATDPRDQVGWLKRGLSKKPHYTLSAYAIPPEVWLEVPFLKEIGEKNKSLNDGGYPENVNAISRPKELTQILRDARYIYSFEKQQDYLDLEIYEGSIPGIIRFHNFDLNQAKKELTLRVNGNPISYEYWLGSSRFDPITTTFLTAYSRRIFNHTLLAGSKLYR